MSKMQELAEWLKQDCNPEAAAQDLGLDIVHNEIYDTSRWAEIYQVVFQDSEDRYYQLLVEHPATEQQEGGDFNRRLEEVSAEEIVVLEFTSKGKESIEWDSTDWCS